MPTLPVRIPYGRVGHFANLGADVTTSGNQTYSGAVILSTNVSLSGGNQLLFGGTVNSSDTDSTSDARTLTTTFTETELDGIIGGTYALGAMDINGDTRFRCRHRQGLHP